jgi:hypothetical protein
MLPWGLSAHNRDVQSVCQFDGEVPLKVGNNATCHIICICGTYLKAHSVDKSAPLVIFLSWFSQVHTFTYFSKDEFNTDVSSTFKFPKGVSYLWFVKSFVCIYHVLRLSVCFALILWKPELIKLTFKNSVRTAKKTSLKHYRDQLFNAV